MSGNSGSGNSGNSGNNSRNDGSNDGGAQQFEVVWDPAAENGAGGWVRRAVVDVPGLDAVGDAPTVSAQNDPRYGPGNGPQHGPHNSPPARPTGPPTAGMTAVPPGGPPRPAERPRTVFGMPVPPPQGHQPPQQPQQPPSYPDQPTVYGAPPGVPPNTPPSGNPLYSPGPYESTYESPYGNQQYGNQQYGNQPPHGNQPAAGDGNEGMARVLLLVALALVLAAAVVTVVIIQPWKTSSDNQAGPSQSPSAGRTSEKATGTPSAPDSAPVVPPTTAAPSPSPTPTPSATTDARAQSAAVDALLGMSGTSRKKVQDAVVSVSGNCSSSSTVLAARGDLTEAADERSSQLTQLGSLRVDLVPGGESAVTELRAAWQASMEADQQFAAWAQSVADNGCGTGVASYKAAETSSGQASAAKARFVQVWNPIAAQYSLPSRTEEAI